MFPPGSIPGLRGAAGGCQSDRVPSPGTGSRSRSTSAETWRRPSSRTFVHSPPSGHTAGTESRDCGQAENIIIIVIIIILIILIVIIIITFPRVWLSQREPAMYPALPRNISSLPTPMGSRVQNSSAARENSVSWTCDRVGRQTVKSKLWSYERYVQCPQSPGWTLRMNHIRGHAGQR